jgi:phage tail-like protein
MADDLGNEEGSTWPLPKFYFSVQFGDDKDIHFQEVSGLESETKPIEYRAGDSPVFAPIKMPGLARVGNVTFKKGIFVKDSKFWAWYSEIKMNVIKRRTVIVHLLDEKGNPRVVWNLKNAWPTKVTGTDLKSEGNEVAVESIEVVFETMTVEMK